MSIDFAAIVSSTISVVLVGIVLGAGLPLLFSLGIVLQDKGAGGEHRDGSITPPNPAARIGAWAIFVAVGLIVLYGLLFLTHKSLDHYLGITLPF